MGRCQRVSSGYGRQSTVAMYVRAVKPVIAVGQYHGTYWIVDEYSRPVRLNEVQYWDPIPAIPHERKAEREEKHYD